LSVFDQLITWQILKKCFLLSEIVSHKILVINYEVARLDKDVNITLILWSFCGLIHLMG